VLTLSQPKLSVKNNALGEVLLDARLGGTFDADRMMRYVFLQVCEDQQKLKHAIAKLRVRLGRLVVETIHDGESVSEEPFEFRRIDSRSIATELQRMIRTKKCFIKKMAEAKPFGSERGWDRVRTPAPAASTDARRGHNILPRFAIWRARRLGQSLSQISNDGINPDSTF
jgi:hypothetical protein